jgi:exosortase/archaeosortase family protein
VTARVLGAMVVVWAALFGALRSDWVAHEVLGPLTALQGDVAMWYAGIHYQPPVALTLDCSGVDVIALCAGAILVFPASWRRRLRGMAGAVVLIVPVNVLRIGTLLAAAPHHRLFSALHLYIWPAVLALVALGYFVVWSHPSAMRAALWASQPANRAVERFVVLSAALLATFALLAPWIVANPIVLLACTWVAQGAAGTLKILGLAASAADNVLWTGRGSFIVTPECIATPVLPVYVSAVLAFVVSRRSRCIWLAAAVPLFIGLGMVRLLVLALPPFLVSTPLFLAHGFYQLLAFAALVVAAGFWQHRSAGAARRMDVLRAAAGACCLGCLVGVIVGPLYAGMLLDAASRLRAVVPHTLSTLVPAGDIQGAIAILPSYQLALLIALIFASGTCGSARRLIAQFALLFASQLALLAILGELAARGVHVPALVIRAEAVAVPIVVLAIGSRWPEAPTSRGLRQFWNDVGDTFPDLGGAASTDCYFDDERRLILDGLPAIRGCRLLKTDLWDEAKNTRILNWAATQGARTYGIDISRPIVRKACAGAHERAPYGLQADVRRIPFRDGSFDAVYSMGTIEHFADSAAALREISRVLRPGGRVILGVPNRHDPFLRPVMVAALSLVGLYAYGYERSFTRRQLRRMLEKEGFRVVEETGILFIPCWLRMLDLVAHVWWPPLSRITGPPVRVFGRIEERWPALRRHGYLLASIAERR